MRLRINHTTRYEYPTRAGESHNEVRLMPISDSTQTCLDFRLDVSPQTRVFAYDLPTGRVHYFDLRASHSELVIRAESLVVTHRQNPFLFLPNAVDDSAFYEQGSIRQDYAEYLAPTERVQLFSETDRIAAVAHRQAGRAGAVPFLMALTRQLYRVITYMPGSTHINTPLLEVLERRQGVCQDFAHLMLAICRRQGIPSRYVSGYLYTRDGAIVSPDIAGAMGTDADDEPHGLVSGNAMHAWVECLLSDGRWHGFDPTNNLLTNDYYVKVHTGREYGDVPPIRGVYRGPFSHKMDVSVRVVAEAL